MTAIEALREEVAAAYAGLGRSGLVTHATGNVSALDRASGLVALTPTGGRPGLGAAEVSVVDVARGEHRDGPPPSSELPSHLALLRAGAGAVVHTHQPHAVAIALVADQVPLLLAEQAIDCGGAVRVLPYVPTGSDAMAAALEAALREGPARAVCLRNHGPFAWGPTLERALASAYALEEAARAWLLARATGAEPLRLPPEEAERLRPKNTLS